MAQTGLNMSRRIRRTPYTGRAEAHGVRGYSVVNHMLLPKAYAASVEEDYWHLREHVQVWDVGCQRQVQVTGPDAAEQADAGRLSNRKNAVMELCRVHGAAAVEQHAAMIEIRGEMVMRPIGRHHAGT